MKTREWVIGGAVVLVAAFLVYHAWFQQGGEAAARAASARNLQQWGIALTLYLMDNDNQLPLVGEAPVTEEQTEAWFNALPPYISQTPLASLPPGSRPRPGVPSLWIDPQSAPVRAWDDSSFYFQYGMNRYLQPDHDLRSFRIYEIPKPNHVVFLAEVDGYIPEATPENVVFRQSGKKPPGADSETLVLFCDGHVQIRNKAQLVDDPNSSKVSNADAGGPSWLKE
jgi:hypothetical protein